MVKKSGYYAFVGTNSVRGSLGIYSVFIDGETLRPELASTHQVYNAGAMDISRSKPVIYAGIEGMTFKGFADGGVIAYSYDESGTLTEIGAARSHGQRTCAISVDGETKNVYGSNFYEGTLAMWGLDENGAPLPARAVVPSADIAGAWKALHCAAAIGQSYVGVISLTECALIVYSARDGRRITSYTFPNRPFCRYLCACGDCLYALMQDPGDIYVFKNHLDENGTIELIQVISVLREKRERYGTTTIRPTPNGKLMLAAARDSSTVTVFRIAGDGRLELGDVVALPGQTPRDFGISGDGKIVVSCLQRSNMIAVHRIDDKNATLEYSGYTLKIPSPASTAVTGRI